MVTTPCSDVMTMSAVFLLLLITISLTSPSYSYYPDYGDDYYYYDQQSNIPVRTVLANNSFTVECQGMHDKQEQVKLVHNGQEMEGYKIEKRIVGEDVVNSFLIERSSLRDSGRWSCVGCLSGEKVDYKIVVIAARDILAMIVDEIPVTNNSVITVIEGTRITPVCALIQNPGLQQGQVSWSLGDTPVGEDIEQMVIMDKEGREHIISTMPSIHVERSHSGSRLQCLLHNQSVSIQLEVEYQPEFTISREPGFGVPVMSQMTVTLGCRVEAVPASLPYWERNGVVVSSGDTMRISNVSQLDEGWYQCSTNHKLGNYSSVGYFLSVKEGVTHHPGVEKDRPTTAGQVLFMESEEISRNYNTSQPTIIPSTGQVTTHLDQSVTLSARLCSNPQPTAVFWVGPLVLLKQGENRDRFSSAPLPDLQGDMCAEVSLEIEQVVSEDMGEYLLVVRNIYGIQEGVIWLEVQGVTASSTQESNCDILLLLFISSIVKLLPEVKV